MDADRLDASMDMSGGADGSEMGGAGGMEDDDDDDAMGMDEDEDEENRDLEVTVVKRDAPPIERWLWG